MERKKESELERLGPTMGEFAVPILGFYSYMRRSGCKFPEAYKERMDGAIKLALAHGTLFVAAGITAYVVVQQMS